MALPPDSTFIEWGIGAVSLMGSMIAAAFISAWRMRSIVAEIETGIGKARIDITDSIRMEYGETMHAFRTKINEIELTAKAAELYVRDNFVRRDELVTVHRHLESLSGRLDDSFRRFEDKIERIIVNKN